jgi:hypothetical protein
MPTQKSIARSIVGHRSLSGGDERGLIRILRIVCDLAVLTPSRPRSVWRLRIFQKAKRFLGLRVQPRNRKTHRPEYVVPRIRFLASPPRDLPFVALMRGEPASGSFDLISIQKSHVRPFVSFRVPVPKL